MLCTVIWDAYGWGDRRAVWDALRYLLPPDGQRQHWSRKGLYVYWDPAIHEMLYTGLATNLSERFAQHNGVIRHSGGNKLADITAWFDEHPHMGFSVMLQAAGVEFSDAIHRASFTLGADSSHVIKAAEGQVIELHRLERGRLPAWNGLGGVMRGQEWATKSARSVIRILTAESDSLFVARRSLRDLAADDSAQDHEVTIHGGRMHALMSSHEVGVRPFDRGDVSKRILKSFMLRSGHLIDDLSPSDAQIIDGLRQIEDGRVLAEYAAMRKGLLDMMLEAKIPGDLEAAKMLYGSALRTELDHPAQAAAVAKVFCSGYLSASPNLILEK
jgi:hypothetical protein